MVEEFWTRGRTVGLNPGHQTALGFGLIAASVLWTFVKRRALEQTVFWGSC